ncbi:MAG: S9 family peptidase [Cyanothece sp. SIO1E1]|nr:S9 family peptidase [Cyanothece sp. SIO1E1]
MIESQVSPYGSWKSPITSDLIVAGTIRLGQIALDGKDIYWSEMRPTEGGRNVIVRRMPDGTTIDITPASFNVRTRVHEYGGGAFTVTDQTIYFSNFADQRLYRQALNAEPQPITGQMPWRYADGRLDTRRQRIICVREDHTISGQEPVNTLVSIEVEASNQTTLQAGGDILVSGHDFYSSPRLSPEGAQLAWISWNHPNMPWDGTELWVADIHPDGSLGPHQSIAGGSEESIVQPEWSPDGILYFISDRTGWWNLYRWHNGQVEPLCPMEAEFGAPHWIFGTKTYGFGSSDRLICSYSQNGTQYLAALDTHTLKLESITIPYARIGDLQVADGYVVFQAGSTQAPSVIAKLDLTTQEIEVLRRSSDLEIDPGYLSEPESITFPTTHGLAAYAFYYPPKNRDYTASADQRPPLLVKSHGGPTAATSPSFSLAIQYWTSRGIAVLDVNYGGSTGYGRAYRQRLQGQWGIVDIDDCVNGARYLVDRDDVDGNRLAIDGGSAGGYTTLGALTFRDTFKAGASYYGVSDLTALAQDTHKFESRYLDGLIGPYPDCKDLYEARSPIHFVDQLSCPVIFFQGDEDKIVPPNQAETMVKALEAKGLPVAYVLFEGEQHGFRKAENIKQALDNELYFYSQVFGFEIAHPVSTVAIANLKNKEMLQLPIE